MFEGSLRNFLNQFINFRQYGEYLKINACKMVKNRSNFVKKLYFWSWATFFEKIFLNTKNNVKSFWKMFFGKIPPLSTILWHDILRSSFSWFLMFSSKMADFGQFGRPIGQCGRSQKIWLIIVSSKKFKISLCDKNSLRYVNLYFWLLVSNCTCGRNKRVRTLNTKI